MKDENKTEDMDLLGDDADLITQAARHLRSCSNCRTHLKQIAGPAAKYTLAEVEREMGRPLTDDEKRILAKTTAVILSRGMAIMAQQAHMSAPIIEAVEKALREGRNLSPFGININSPVGEA